MADFRYLAGLFDGEGAVGICRHTSGPHPVFRSYVSIHMADTEVLHQLKGEFGGCLQASMRGEGRRPTWIWRLEASSVTDFLTGIRPHIRLERRRQAIDVVLAFQAQKTSTARGLDRGGPKTVAYRDRQERYWRVMRELNKRGEESLPDDARRIQIASLPRGAQP